MRAQFANGRSHSLKSSLRLRAVGHVTTSTRALLAATLRFEAVVPDESFCFQQIRPPPLLSTPLSLKLACATRTDSLAGVWSAGYLTLNRTRKVVPLLETDPAVSLAPLVGVWVGVGGGVGGGIGGGDGNGGQSPQPPSPHTNPFIVAACVRFLKDAKIRERVFVDSDQTFLLALFSGHSTDYFEVTRALRVGDELDDADDFCVVDFTVDLVRGGAPVVGRFRGLSEPSSLAAAWQPDASSSEQPPLQQQLPQVLFKSYGNVQILASYSNSISGSSNPLAVGVEEMTPLPRNEVPPPPTPEAYRAAPEGSLRTSLSLSSDAGSLSNRSSLDSDQLMRVVGIVATASGGVTTSAASASASASLQTGSVAAQAELADEPAATDRDDEGEDEDEDEQGDDDSAAASAASEAADDDSESESEGGASLRALLEPWSMSVPTDDSDFTLSQDLRRTYFPTNPLASQTPCLPLLRPLGEEESLLMETGIAGIRTSLNSGGISAAFASDLDEQVREIMLHEADDE